MATLKEIATAAEKADRAGNTEDAKKLVNLYFRMMEKNIKKETTSPSLTDKDVKLKESSNVQEEPSKVQSFQDKMKQSESSGRYGIINKEGFIGAYQFGDARLTDYRKVNKVDFTNDEFKSNKELQDKVFKWHVDDIQSNVKKKGLDKYIGTKILGIEVTMDGITAMSHLGGQTGMQKFLESEGKYNPEDSNGTSLSDYLQKFGK